MPRRSLHSLPRLTLTTISLLLILLAALSTCLEFSYAHSHAHFSIQSGGAKVVIRAKPLRSLPDLFRRTGRSQWQVKRVDFALNWKPESPRFGPDKHYYLPLWIPAAATGLPASFLWFRTLRRRRLAHIAAHRPCPSCGYSRVGLPLDARCPECNGNSRYSKLETAIYSQLTKAHARFQRSGMAQRLRLIRPSRERFLRWAGTVAAFLLLASAIASTFVMVDIKSGRVSVSARCSRLEVRIHPADSVGRYFYIGLVQFRFHFWPSIASNFYGLTIGIPLWMPFLPTALFAAATWLAKRGARPQQPTLNAHA